MNKILKQIQTELKNNVDEKYRDGSINFFKEPIKVYGVRSKIVREIGRRYYQQISHLPKAKIFQLCEELLKTNHNEDANIAFAWARKLNKQYSKADFKTFESWLKKYVTNWGMCDDFCTHAFGDLLTQFPEFLPRVKKWTKSKNRWVRRAAAVIFINSNQTYHTGKNKLKDIFEVADLLLTDKDDMVQKGYGWMLKAASFHHQKPVFDYVMKNKAKMPRTALRYAIEKMPKSWKIKAMKK